MRISSAAPAAPSGYTLIEVMIAVSILMTAVAAAAQMTLVMHKQEEANWNVARAINLGENAVRLYRLGLSPDDVVSLLPADPNVTVSYSNTSLAIPSATPALEAVDWTVSCTVLSDQPEVRDFTFCAVRPSIR